MALLGLVLPGLVAMVACFAAGVGVATRRSLLLPIAGSLAGELIGGGPFNPLVLMVTFGPWAAGAVVRSRRTLARQLIVVGRQLEDERARYAQAQLHFERVRLARELHDTIAHWLTAVVVQATAGQVLTATRPVLASETLDHIAEAARCARQDVDRALALMGGPDLGTDDLALVDRLVAGAVAAGVDVRVSVSGEPRLPLAASTTAVRIVQEGITNAMKHAPGAPVQISLRATGRHLEIVVLNQATARGPTGGEPSPGGPSPGEPSPGGPSALGVSGAGLGLLGLCERAEAIGGRVESGPTSDHGWRLAASLPC